MGVTGSWPAYAIYFFTKTKDVSATMAECAQMVSLAEIGRIICAIPGGLLTDKYGRKKINRVTGIIHFVAWVILSSSTSITSIYIARYVSLVSFNRVVLLFLRRFVFMGMLVYSKISRMGFYKIS